MSETNKEEYSASTGVLLSLTYAMTTSLAPDVRVNTVSTGWIQSGRIKKDIRTKTNKSPQRRYISTFFRKSKVNLTMSKYDGISYIGKAGFVFSQNFIIHGGIPRKMIYA